MSNNNQWSDLPKRLLTICVGVPLLWFLWSFHPMTRHVFFQGAHIVMCWEWCVLSKMPQTSAVTFGVVSVALANDVFVPPQMFVVGLMWACSILPIAFQATTPSTLLPWMTGFLWVTTTNRTWLVVSQDFYATVSLLLTVWNVDTGALIAGRLGKACHTRFPRPQWLINLSPAKSLEGILGGLVAGILTYWSLPTFWKWIDRLDLAALPQEESDLFSLEFMSSSSSFLDRLPVGLFLSTAAILGDLWESCLKRAFHVKDSGKLLPGHGGVLDRFDSSLIAVVVFYHLFSIQ